MGRCVTEALDEARSMPFHPFVVAAVMAFGAASPTEAPSPTSVTLTPACEVTQAKYARYTRAVYREREEISSRARQRIDRMRRCAKSEEAERNMVILRRREAREREERQRIEAVAATIPPHLNSIAACESGGDPRAVSAGGLYRGKYQFDLRTWQEAGGSGDPAAASEAEQDMRAAILYRKAGPGRWPVCGR
jgi:hypothetical protein